MNPKPIEESGDSDLIGSVAAMQRAAAQARELARSTSTMLVVELDGQVVQLSADELEKIVEEQARSNRSS